MASIFPVAGSESIADCTESSLRAALETGGLHIYACTGTVYVTSRLVVTNTVAIQATPGQIAIVGHGTNGLFQVSANGSLTLQGLTLRDGAAVGKAGATGSTSQAGGRGGEARGGAIWVQTNGAFYGTELIVSTNSAVGGAGGNGGDGEYANDGPGDGGGGGIGRGGAIYNEGVVELTDCVLQGNSAAGGAGGSGGDGQMNQHGADAGDGARADGGAIYNAKGARLTLVECVLNSNSTTAASGGTNGLAGRGGLSYPGTIGSSASASGGAIQNDGGDVTLVHCQLTYNNVLAADGVPGAQGTTDQGSASGGNGGTAAAGAVGIRGGNLSTTYSVFLENTVRGGLGGDGGQVAYSGDGGDGGEGGDAVGGAVTILESAVASFVGCSFATNTVQAAGGGLAAGGTAALSRDGSDGSAGSGGGGGIWIDTGTVSVDRCMFEANVVEGAGGIEGLAGRSASAGSPGSAGGAAGGAGIKNLRGSLAISNCTFSANAATGGDGGNGGAGGAAADGGNGGAGGRAEGGALHNESGRNTVVYCTFAGNLVTGGTGGEGGGAGGGFADDGEPGARGVRLGSALANGTGRIGLRGSVLWAAATNILAASGSVVDEGYNLSSDRSPEFAAASSSKGSVPDLGLVSPASNGGPTRTLALATNSPALNQVPEDAGPPPVDQRGHNRVMPADVGAYERDATAPNPPYLGLILTPPELEFSWPVDGESYAVQSSRTVTMTVWTNVTAVATVRSNRWVLTIPAPSNSNGFYRLTR